MKRWLGVAVVMAGVSGLGCGAGDDGTGGALTEVSRESSEALSSACAANTRCVVDLPATKCGDGSRSFVNVIDRKNPNDLYLFLQGGGACWDRATCGCTTANGCTGITAPTLTRADPTQVENAWSTDLNGPVAGFNVVEIPYCTGDVHSGRRTANYGSGLNPLRVEHNGYANVTASLAYAKARFPGVKRVVVVGQSAGALGVEFNLSQVRKTFPAAKIYAVADSGAPFRPPQLALSTLRSLYDTWGSAANLPPGIVDTNRDGVVDFAEIIDHNTKAMPEVKFGLDSAYGDVVFGAFIALLGSPPKDAVKNILLTTAANELNNKPNAKGFYINGGAHVLALFPPESTKSQGVYYVDWVKQMVSDSPAWTTLATPPN